MLKLHEEKINQKKKELDKFYKLKEEKLEIGYSCKILT